MPRFKLLIAYNGRHLHGWQRQRDVPTVQGTLEQALQTMNAGQPILLSGASRTDAGVHAEGQVAIFDYEGKIDASSWLRGLNALTPDTITVRDVTCVDDTFHPRFQSLGKHYRYLLWHGCLATPRWRPWVWEHRRPLDLNAIQLAAQQLLGEHDFNAFRASDCDARTSVRHISRIELVTMPTGWIRPRDHERRALIALEFEGNAFLKYMIRIIVGTLVEVGLGQRTPASVAEALQSGDRRRAGITGPPQGLTLVEVFYEGERTRTSS